MLDDVRKWFAIRSYIKKLGPELRRRYGAQSKYSPAQVRATIQSKRFDADRGCYAMAMYCDRADFDRHHQSTGESCSYDTMRAEIGSRLFGGNTTFDVASLVNVSENSGLFDFAPSADAGFGAGGDGGGDAGGDGGAGSS